ncbi:MAG TPA: AAA family ATPase [Dehalococcoidia bacterium]|nr:AAA family ATPase [Dehalococcoidia bacterium]
MTSKRSKTTESQLPPHVRAFLREGVGGEQPQLVQTHISYVLLTSDEVYKLKKPVNLGFANFSTLEDRRIACEAEMRLNLRGCPGGVYLGVVAVTRRGDGYELGGAGEVVDYAVHMKRLPRDGMMDAMLERGEVDLDKVGRVAARMAAMHEAAARGPEITKAGGVNTFAANWQDLLADMRAAGGSTLSRRRLERLASYVRAYFERERPLLERRERDGWVRDCHGDLRSDAVCFDPSLPGGICIYDCIEFNERFRYSDTGLDVAFLGMDLDYRGRPDLSDLFIGLYAASAGDETLALVLHFYKCYRAVVRGRVETLLGQDAAVSQRKRAAARGRARRYFQLAEQYALRPSPAKALVLVMGLSGSGKSVLAGALASRLGAAILSTDVVRRSIVEEHERGVELNAGVYTPQQRTRVYEELTRRAEALLRDDRCVVLDGTFSEREQRNRMSRLAERLGAPLRAVECFAPDDVVRQRQQRREGEAWTTSEGRWDVYLAQKARYEPPAELPPGAHLRIDTTQPLETQLTLATDAGT